jgi:hypothetical protein
MTVAAVSRLNGVEGQQKNGAGERTMNRIFLKRVFPQILALVAVAALAGMVATAQSAAPATRTDGQIEMDVVHILDATSALKADLITAATIQGEVTLTGTVASESNRKLAESVVGQVPGVSAVHNSLKIGEEQQTGAAAGGDQQSDQTQDNNPPPPPQDQAQGNNPPPPPQGAQPQYAYPPRQYAPARPPAPVYEPATGPVTVPAGTLLVLRTREPIRSKHAKDGTPVEFMVARDVAVGGVLAIPRGATVHGVVTEDKQAGDLKGGAVLGLVLTTLDLGGQSYPLDSTQFKVKGPGKGNLTANNVVGGTVMGTIVGCIAGRGVGCAVGAGAGALVGTGAAAAAPKPGIWIPAEARVQFHLKSPLTVNPVSAREAARLAQGLYQGGPNLYRRGYYPYPYGYPYGYPPPVYYRPY